MPHRLEACAPPISSREKLLDDFDGDEALLQRMIALFAENTPRLLDDIRASIDRLDARGLARSAHALLSSVGAFGAKAASQLTRQLEGHAGNEDFAAAASSFAELEAEATRLYVALEGLASADA